MSMLGLQRLQILMQYIQCRVCPFSYFWFSHPSLPRNGWWVPLRLRCGHLEWGGLAPSYLYLSLIKFSAIASSSFLFFPGVSVSCMDIFQMFSEWIGPGRRTTCSNKGSQTHLSSSVWIRDIFLIFPFYWSSQKNPGLSIHICLRLRAQGCGTSDFVLLFLLKTVRLVQYTVAVSSLWANSRLF